MGICKNCGKEAMDASVTTCEGTSSIQYPDGTLLPKTPFNPRTLHLPNWHRCPDCGVAAGGYHHWNCDQENCPKCGGQLVSCPCFDSEGPEAR